MQLTTICERNDEVIRCVRTVYFLNFKFRKAVQQRSECELELSDSETRTVGARRVLNVRIPMRLGCSHWSSADWSLRSVEFVCCEPSLSRSSLGPTWTVDYHADTPSIFTEPV